MSIPDWVRREPTIWVTDVDGVDPRIPTGACVVTVEEAAAVVGGAPLSAELGFAWFQGAAVRSPPDAHPSVAQMVTRLNARLSDLTPGELAELAHAHGLSKTAAALRGWTPHTPISRAAIAAHATDESPDGTPLLGREARLLMALEYL